MAGSFCDRCGERLRAGARFCAGCGAKVEVRPDQPSVMHGSGISLPRLEPLVPNLLQERESRGEQVAPWGLTTKDLDHFVSSSLVNAVMDTSYLLIGFSAEDCIWLPISKITGLRGMTVQAAAMITYHIDEEALEPFCLPELLRDEAAIDVMEAFLKVLLEKPCVRVNIALKFHPVDYGNLAAEITGHWATVVNDQGVNDIRAILKMPFPGKVLKKRLSDHEAVVQQILDAAVHDGSGSEEAREAAELFKQILRNLRTVVKQMPDGEADHMYCVASVSEGETAQPTVQADLTPGERKPPARLDFNRRITRLFKSGSGVLLKSRPTKIASGRPLRSSLLQDIRREFGRDVANRVKGQLRSTR
jgi:hypothetical protein